MKVPNLEKYFQGFCKDRGRPDITKQAPADYCVSIHNTNFYVSYEQSQLPIFDDGINWCIASAAEFAIFSRSKNKLRMILRLIQRISISAFGNITLNNTHLVHIQNYQNDYRSSKFIDFAKKFYLSKTVVICEKPNALSNSVLPEQIKCNRIKAFKIIIRHGLRVLRNCIGINYKNKVFLSLQHLLLRLFLLKLNSSSNLKSFLCFCGSSPFANITSQYLKHNFHQTYEIAHGWPNTTFLPIKTDKLLCYHKSTIEEFRSKNVSRKYLEVIGGIYILIPEDDGSTRQTKKYGTLGLTLTNQDDIGKILNSLLQCLSTMSNLEILIREHPMEVGQLKESNFMKYLKGLSYKFHDPNQSTGDFFSKVNCIVGFDSSILLDACLVDIPCLSIAVNKNQIFANVEKLGGTQLNNVQPKKIKDFINRNITTKKTIISREVFQPTYNEQKKCLDNS